MAAIAAVTASSASADQLEVLAQRVGVRVLADATSDKAIMESAQSQIPYGKMSARSQQRASFIAGNASLYRRMPSLQYEVNPDIYQYLINHPDVAISTWRVMGISKLEMTEKNAFQFAAAAADGSRGDADVLWRDGSQCLFLTQGSYVSPLLPNAIEASALVWLRYRFVPTKTGTVLVNQQVETFVYFPSGAVDTLVRLASVVTNTILDRNVFEVSLYAKMMSSAAEKEPEWIEQVAQRMDGVRPERRVELAMVARGRNPADGRVLPSATGTVPNEKQSTSGIAQSGQFRNFESSLQEVNVMVPLVASEVQHEASYGTKIGDSSPLMARPMEYTPAEAGEVLAEREERRRRALAYDQYYSNPDAVGTPELVSPGAVPGEKLYVDRTPSISANMTHVPGLAVDSASSRQAAKASPAGPPADSSRPLKTVSSSASATSDSNPNAKPVSRSQPLTTDGTTDAGPRDSAPQPALPPAK
ncbi:MAG: hypothetical protein R3C49_24585 [Planctomycetaceae bacterium]